MTVATLKTYVSKEVIIQFFDEDIKQGVLGYVKEFSEEYGFRKPNDFFIDNLSFRVSHVKRIKAVNK